MGKGAGVFDSIMGMLQDAVKALGMVVAIWGAVQFGLAFKEKSGSEMAQAAACVFGGIVIIAAAAYFSRIDGGVLGGF